MTKLNGTGNFQGCHQAGETTAVDRLNFTIEAGQMITLLAPVAAAKPPHCLVSVSSRQVPAQPIGDRDIPNPATDRDVTMVFSLMPCFRI